MAFGSKPLPRCPLGLSNLNTEDTVAPSGLRGLVGLTSRIAATGDWKDETLYEQLVTD